MHNFLPAHRLLARRVLWLWRHQRSVMLAWALPVALLAASTAMGNHPASHHLARWGLLLGLLAAVASIWRMARWVTQHLTYVLSLWEENVPLNVDPQVRQLFPTAQHRGARAREQA